MAGRERKVRRKRIRGRVREEGRGQEEERKEEILGFGNGKARAERIQGKGKEG